VLTKEKYICLTILSNKLKKIFKANNTKSNWKMLIVKSLGSTNKGVDRVHNKYIQKANKF
jgi:hypothetical protein